MFEQKIFILQFFQSVLMLQLGSFYGNDEAKYNSQQGRFAHDPRFDPNVGHVQSRGQQSEFIYSCFIRVHIVRKYPDMTYPLLLIFSVDYRIGG